MLPVRSIWSELTPECEIIEQEIAEFKGFWPFSEKSGLAGPSLVHYRRERVTKTDAVAKKPEVDSLVQQSLDAAIKRIEAQRAYYEEGRITLDRYIDACRELELAQLMAAQTGVERTAIKERHVVLLKEIEDREKAELTVGRGTDSDVGEAVQKRTQAETELKTEQDLPSILRRLIELERKVEELQRNSAVK